MDKIATVSLLYVLGCVIVSTKHWSGRAQESLVWAFETVGTLDALVYLLRKARNGAV